MLFQKKRAEDGEIISDGSDDEAPRKKKRKKNAGSGSEGEDSDRKSKKKKRRYVLRFVCFTLFFRFVSPPVLCGSNGHQPLFLFHSLSSTVCLMSLWLLSLLYVSY